MINVKKKKIFKERKNANFFFLKTKKIFNKKKAFSKTKKKPTPI